MKAIFTFFLLLSTIANLCAQGYSDLLSGKAHDLHRQGVKCWTEGGGDCIRFFQEAYQLTNKQAETCPGCIEVDLAKSYSYLEKFDSAAYFLNRARLSMEKMDYSDLRVKHLDAEIQNNLSMNFYYLGKIDSAIFYIKKNIEVIDKTGNKKSSAFAKINLAAIYTVVNDYQSAIQNYLKAFRELEALNMLDDSRVAVLAGNLATAYHETGATDSSSIWARKAIEWGNKTQSVTAQFYGNYLMGVNLSKTQPDSALLFFDESLKAARTSGRPSFLAKSKMVKGVILSDMKRYPEAMENLLEAVKLMERNPADPDYLETIRNLGLAASENGDHKIASAYLKEYTLLKDSLNVTKNQELLHEFQTKYETEKKEKQISEQKLKIQKQRANLLYAILGGTLLLAILGGVFIYSRKTQKLKLQHLQQEKENAILNSFILGEERERNRISHELHDGVAAMIGAAKMSLESLPHLPQEKQAEQLSKVKKILENTHADVRHIAHNLLPSVLEKEGLQKATAQFAAEINETNLINISVNDKLSNDLLLSPQMQLMLFRVIQELVNNIIKHSQAQNAEITFSSNPNGLEIEITDDGIGYEHAKEPGNQGLYSITQRLKSIGGNFKIRRGHSGGTQAKVEVVV